MKYRSRAWIGLTFILSLALSSQICPANAFDKPLNSELALAKLDEGTPIKLCLLQELVSGKNVPGELLTFEARQDVYTPDGRVVVAKGAHAKGHILRSSKRGMLGKSGKITFSAETVEAVDGTIVPLRATSLNQGQSNSTATVASAILLTPLALLVHGRDVTLKEGTVFEAYVAQDVTIDLAKAPGAQPVAALAPTNNNPSLIANNQAPAKFTILSKLLQGRNIVGKLRNDGPSVSSVQVVVVVRNGNTVVGLGNATLARVPVGKKVFYSVPIDGKTKGTISVEANAK